MASNDQWPPVASVGKGTAKINGNKRNIKDLQQKILSTVTEMFGSALEPEIILTVVQNCKWELEPSIEGLITLTETMETPQSWDEVGKTEEFSSSSVTAPICSGLLGGSKEVLKKLPSQEPPVDAQQMNSRLQPKWEKPKKGGSKNRMNSFCGNIAKLKSSTEGNAFPIKQEPKPKNSLPIKDEFSFPDILNYGASGVEKLTPKSPKLENSVDSPEMQSGTESTGLYGPPGEKSWSQLSNRLTLSNFVKSSSFPRNESKTNEKFLESKAAAEKAEFSKDPKRDCKPVPRKDETESLCGLKVQYRITGMESSSDDDDDADVVIEDEASDYKINLTPAMSTNVSQFLSPATQTAPKRTLPEFQMISTPSPRRTAPRSPVDPALSPIITTVENGYKIMILLRGLPGSGKSTLAKKIVASTVGGNSADFVFNTDDFFVNLGRGVYKFDPSKLHEAHNSNHKRVWLAVKEGRSPVIVDNTHIEAWEMRPYAAMAVEHGYIVETLEPQTPWAQNINQLAKKNTHNVPKAKIRDRAQRYERNINGKSLLERYSLKYSPNNNPPQMRIIPPVEKKNSAISANNADIKSNWTNQEKNKYILTSHDMESMRNIDENHGAIKKISESTSATDSSESSSNTDKGTNFREEVFNDYLQELHDSDDESFEMLEGCGNDNLSDFNGKSGESKENCGSHRNLASANISPEQNAEESVEKTKNGSPINSQQILGAIGSERKGSFSVGSSLGNLNNEKSEKKNLSPNGSQQFLGAIGSERKGSLSVGSSLGNSDNEKSEKKNSSPNGSQQLLGAIGSERKGSLSAGSSLGNSDNEKSEKKNSSPNGSQQLLGAIGSERKGSLSAGSSLGNSDNEKSEKKNSSPNGSQQFLGAIGSERKGSLSAGSSRGNSDNEKSEKKNSSPKSSQPVLGAIGSERKGSFSISANVQNITSEKTEIKDSNGTQQSLGAIGSERKGSFSHSANVQNITSEKTEIKDSNSTQQSLGAIGSERKSSFSVASNSANIDTEIGKVDAEKNDNVLDQCLDFTLLLGRYKIHSTHSKYRAPPIPSLVTKTKEEAASEEKEQDANDKNDKNENTLLDVENILNKDVCNISENQSSVHNSFSDEGISVDEKEEEVKNLEVENEETKNDENLTVGEAVIIYLNSLEKDKETIEPENELLELSDDFKTEKSDEIESSDSLVEKIEQAKDVTETVTKEVNEVSETAPKASTAFGTFLNMLKTSLLGGTEETSSNNVKDANTNISGSSVYENAISSPSTSKPEDSDPSEDLSSDSVDSPIILEKSADPKVDENLANEITVKSTDKNDDSHAQIPMNPFTIGIIKSLKKKYTNDEQQLITDNINSISWKESPFPIDGTKIPVLPIPEDNKEVLKLDASTNTTYYDFNVAYVGGTSEPGYRELNAVSRCINQGISVAKIERPPLKLMLDKSSMTNEVNILATEQNLNMEKDKDTGNRIQELVELFPNIPIDSLTAFYNQECKGNFDWAVEVLLEGVPTDFTIKSLTKRCTNIKSEEISTVEESVKKSNIEIGRFKQRSHSSSPRHRRQKIKDFRSFSVEYVENPNCSSRDNFVDDKEVSSVNNGKEIVLESLPEKSTLATNVSPDIAEIPDASSSSTASGVTETEDDVDEVLELDFGREFVNKLEKTFGNDDFTFPDEFKPVIKIKKSMAQQLHALWIESMYDQMNERHAKLDMMIAKDEAMARALDREESVQAPSEIAVPNLEEIMDMELALACYKNELKEKIARETPNDMASRLTRQMLCESLPDIDPQTLSEILKAHDGNFKETCETIENSTGRTISKSDTLKKQQSLLDRIKEESKNREIPQNSEDFAPLIVVNPDIYAGVKDDQFSYRAAVARGENARKEAQKQFALRMENFNKAAEAYRKGYPGVAAYYSQMAKLHYENIETAHAEAADAFVSAQIYHSDNEYTLDLHNFFVSEALQALDKFLEFQLEKLGKSNKRSSTLYIITGRGARSNNGLSKIKPAVSKKLTSRNIRFTEDNPGCLKVTLSRRNCILE